MSTLILPLVTNANLPQLAADLLRHSTNNTNAVFNHIENFSPVSLIPIFGAGDHIPSQSIDNNNISTSLELSFSSTFNTYLLLQRSPHVPGYLSHYLNQVVKPLIEKLKINKIIILSSRDAPVLPNNENIFYHDFKDKDELSQLLEDLTITSSNNGTYDRQILLTDLEENFIKACFATNLQISKLTFGFTTVAEGDNSIDAYNFAKSFIDQFQWNDITLNKPISWNGVYGRDFNGNFEEGLYI